MTAVSNQIPLILNPKVYKMTCIFTCLSTSNCIVKIITEIATRNPMSCSGDNFRDLLDSQCTLNLEHFILNWKSTLK